MFEYIYNDVSNIVDIPKHLMKKKKEKKKD